MRDTKDHRSFSTSSPRILSNLGCNVELFILSAPDQLRTNLNESKPLASANKNVERKRVFIDKGENTLIILEKNHWTRMKIFKEEF